jgi:hypothetical protein
LSGEQKKAEVINCDCPVFRLRGIPQEITTCKYIKNIYKMPPPASGGHGGEMVGKEISCNQVDNDQQGRERNES